MAFNVGDLLLQWESFGIFYYVLPFLLIFALVFAILQKSKFGDNKGAVTIISLAVGALSLYGGWLPNFLQVMAPNLAIAISILLAALILLGLFTGTETKWVNNIIIGIAIVALIFVIYDALTNAGGFFGFGWFEQYLPSLIVLVLIGIVVGVIVKGSGSGSKP